MSIKRMLGLGWLVGLLGALAFAIPAQATVKAVCQVAGIAKVEDKDGSGRGVLLVGGHGNYTFKQTPFTCVGDEKGSPAVSSFSVVSEGFYDNIVCGTGKAISPWGKSRMVPGSFSKNPNAQGDPEKDEAFYSDMISELKYAVEFEGTKGRFFWHNDPDGPKPESTSKPPTIPKTGTEDKVGWDDPDSDTAKEYVFAGEIELDPPEGDPTKPGGIPDVANGECTDAFLATGAIVVHR